MIEKKTTTTPTAFPKEIGDMFAFWRSTSPSKGKWSYGSHWKRNYLKLYGDKGDNAILGSYIIAAGEIASLRDGNGKLKEDSTIRAKIGAIDELNPLITLSLGCLTLARAMHIKAHSLKTEDKIGAYRALKALQVTFNLLINFPLALVNVVTSLVWNLAKAVVAAVAVTIGSVVTAPIDRNSNRTLQK